jgi:hypothetical protein
MASDPEKKADFDTVEKLSDKLEHSDTTDSDKLNDERINAFSPAEQRKIIHRSMCHSSCSHLTVSCHADKNLNS